MNGKYFAEKLESIDDIYLDEALECVHAPRIKRVKTLLVFVAAIVCLIAACVVAAADMEVQPKPKKYPEGADAEKFMNAFGVFYDPHEEGKTFVLSSEVLRLEAEYPDDGGVIIKIVDVDYSVAPFDTHPNIIINGHMVKGAGGAADPFVGTFDPDTFIGASGMRNTDDGSLIKYALISGTELRIDRMAFASDEAQDEAFKALSNYGRNYSPDYRSEDFSSFNSYKVKAAEEGKLLDTAENPIYDTVSILSLVAYNDEGGFCEVIGDWEIEVEY